MGLRGRRMNRRYFENQRPYNQKELVISSAQKAIILSASKSALVHAGSVYRFSRFLSWMHPKDEVVGFFHEASKRASIKLLNETFTKSIDFMGSLADVTRR